MAAALRSSSSSPADSATLRHHVLRLKTSTVEVCSAAITYEVDLAGSLKVIICTEISKSPTGGSDDAAGSFLDRRQSLLLEIWIIHYRS
jgi:hypothetical protein